MTEESKNVSGYMAARSLGHGAPTQIPPNVPTEHIVSIEIPVQQATRKVKLEADKTVQEVIQQVIKKMAVDYLVEYLALWIKTSGIWMEDQRKIFTYLLNDDDVLELKHKVPGVTSWTIEVYYTAHKARETLKVYPETTVRGIIQLMEHKRYNALDKAALLYNGIPLDKPNSFISSYDIKEGSVLEWREAVEQPPVGPPRGVPLVKGVGAPVLLAELRTKQTDPSIKKTTSSFVLPPRNPQQSSAPAADPELLAALQKRRPTNILNNNEPQTKSTIQAKPTEQAGRGTSNPRGKASAGPARNPNIKLSFGPEGGRGSYDSFFKAEEGRSYVEDRRGSVDSFYKPEDLPPPPPEEDYIEPPPSPPPDFLDFEDQLHVEDPHEEPASSVNSLLLLETLLKEVDARNLSQSNEDEKVKIGCKILNLIQGDSKYLVLTKVTSVLGREIHAKLRSLDGPSLVNLVECMTVCIADLSP